MNWEEVNQFIDALIKKVPNNITGVFGIPRGGLCLAVILSHKLNIPLLLAPCKNCIIVDDIADTGKTLLQYKDKGYFIATMYYHKQSKVIPDFWFKEKKDNWITFVWEK